MAYYVEWHLRRSWAPLLFEEEELEQAWGARDPVAKAAGSEAVDLKKKTRLTESGLEVHGFRTLLADLGRQTRNTWASGGDSTQASLEQISEATPLQADAFRLLGLCSSCGPATGTSWPSARSATTSTAWLARVKLSMHALRRGFGCRYAGRVPSQVLQRLMRPSDIKTTMASYANVEDAVE